MLGWFLLILAVLYGLFRGFVSPALDDGDRGFGARHVEVFGTSVIVVELGPQQYRTCTMWRTPEGVAVTAWHCVYDVDGWRRVGSFDVGVGSIEVPERHAYELRCNPLRPGERVRVRGITTLFGIPRVAGGTGVVVVPTVIRVQTLGLDAVFFFMSEGWLARGMSGAPVLDVEGRAVGVLSAVAGIDPMTGAAHAGLFVPLWLTELCEGKR